MAMVFKKKFDPPIKILIFYLTIFWVGIVFLIFLASRYVTITQSEVLNTKLQIINDYLSFSYSPDSVQNKKDYIRFLDTYFKENEEYDGLIVSIFDVKGSLIYSSDSSKVANVLPLNYPEVRNALKGGHDYTSLRMDKITKRPTFFAATYNKERNIVIITKIPYTSSYFKIFLRERKMMLIVTILLSAFFTIAITYYILRYNKKLDVANLITKKIENQEPIEIPKRISKDRLGEITRTVIKLYQEKIQYLEEKEYERIMAVEIEKNNLTEKRKLLNNLKHEFKTPLGIIQGYVETLLYHKRTPVEIRERFLQNCLKNISRLERLLETTSLLTLVEDGRDSFSLEKNEFYPVAKETFEDMATQLKEKGIKYEISVPEDLIVKSNTILIATLFYNFIQNAINYSKCSSIILKLESEDEKFYTFVFADNGVGVKEENLQKIFQRFYREDKSASRVLGGSGLGLSIVSSIIRMHEGKIKVENIPTGGLKFTFSIPKFIVAN